MGVQTCALPNELARATPDRLLVAAQAIREGLSLTEINRISGYDRWFLDRIAEIVAAEEQVMAEGLPRDATGLRKLKAMGFSDKRLAYLAHQSAHLPGGARGAAYGSGLIHDRSEEHTSELQSLMRSSYAVFCLKKKTERTKNAKTQDSNQVSNTTIIN